MAMYCYSLYTRKLKCFAIHRVSAGSYYDVGYEGSEDFTSSIYCSCSEGGEKLCGYSQNIDECSISTGVEYTQELLKDQRDQSLSQFTGRRKRQTTGFKYDPNYHDSQVLVTPIHDSQTATWPTASGTTEEQARTLCTNKVRSAQLECANFDPQNYTVEIQKCVQDIKLTDNQDWSESALQDVQTRCLSSVSRNAGAWEQQNNTAILPRQVVKTLCPGYCTGNGTCDDTRKCVCNTEVQTLYQHGTK
ncbi:uncharacterized protein LOC124272344 [Haliotis rubra]|uniref:uncharacterized protein LOC124272344 n=1 Tax=Haliotis rubra TaxID=36100 RepID=UPI001EE5CA10|nr:uncharacterized protein LOC124272344 [Haliotis rubra]